jgi:hypothetical protein
VTRTENGVGRIHVDLLLGGVTDKPIGVIEGDGVVLLPRSSAMISTRPFRHTPTREHAVPKSIPIAGPSLFAIPSSFTIRERRP